jgi:hypothetical protein
MNFGKFANDEAAAKAPAPTQAAPPRGGLWMPLVVSFNDLLPIYK